MRALALTFLLGLAVRPVVAQDSPTFDVDHEEWKVIGWTDGCAVAFEHLYYPKLGEAIASEPISTRVGTAMIPTEKQDYVARWVLEADGPLSWSPAAVEQAEKKLKAAGYTRPGFPEFIQDGPIGDQPLLAATILSTGTLNPRVKKGWPGPEWRWIGGSYNPLGTCALLAYEKRDAPRHYRLLPIRVYNPRARIDRSYAHASNARLLFNAGDLDHAAVEAETAALLAPELPIARYENAAMLSLTGRVNEAVPELAAAIALEPKFKEKARDDIDFDSVRKRDDFKDATR